ncbi:uncharacterized protein V1518DRAFT_418210 [Limtongia smithiae]|uniref:uncharacterized protein n=1 Tax=Limtongia smithiae TaxID=1125753 RepID=UPI0034CEEA92
MSAAPHTPPHSSSTSFATATLASTRQSSGQHHNNSSTRTIASANTSLLQPSDLASSSSHAEAVPSVHLSPQTSVLLTARSVPVFAATSTALARSTGSGPRRLDGSPFTTDPSAAGLSPTSRELLDAGIPLAQLKHSAGVIATPKAMMSALAVPHQHDRIISVAELDQQMALDGPWNPHGHRHAASADSSAGGPARPESSAAAHHHFFEGGSTYSSSFELQGQHPMMTAELAEKRRQLRKFNIRRALLNNQFVPLTLRLGIFILSVLALAMSSSIYHYTSIYDTAQNLISDTSSSTADLSQQPSTIMAICVQSCALLYLCYITYDEYSGRPLGLRDARAKITLIMCDLLFIIFSSANLSLTFNTLYDAQFVCQSSDVSGTANSSAFDSRICRRQKGLAAFLFLVLLMWVMTFTISILRVVERVSGASVMRS